MGWQITYQWHVTSCKFQWWWWWWWWWRHIQYSPILIHLSISKVKWIVLPNPQMSSIQNHSNAINCSRYSIACHEQYEPCVSKHTYAKIFCQHDIFSKKNIFSQKIVVGHIRQLKHRKMALSTSSIPPSLRNAATEGQGCWFFSSYSKTRPMIHVVPLAATHTTVCQKYGLICNAYGNIWIMGAIRNSKLF